MIKVLKEGHGNFKEAFCSHCGCEFAYQIWDVEIFALRGGFRFVDINCPTCHKKIRLGRLTLDERIRDLIKE